MMGAGRWTVLLAFVLAAPSLRAQQPSVFPTAIERLDSPCNGACEIIRTTDGVHIRADRIHVYFDCPLFSSGPCRFVSSLAPSSGTVACELAEKQHEFSGVVRQSDWWGAAVIPGWRPIALRCVFPDVYPQRHFRSGVGPVSAPEETWTCELFQCPTDWCLLGQLILDNSRRHVVRLSDGSYLIVNDTNVANAGFGEKTLLFFDDDNFSLPFQFGGPDTIKYPDGTYPPETKQRFRTFLLQLLGLSMEFNF
jgi:hypothetical protein